MANPNVAKYKEESKSYRAQQMVTRVLAYIFLVFVTFLSLFSFYLLIINGSRSNAELQAGFTLIPSTHFGDNFITAITDNALFSLPRGLWNSFFIASSSAILTTYFSAMTAYGIHVYDFKGKKFIFTFILAVMMIPTQVSAAGFIQLVNQVHLNDTYWPLIIPAIAAPAIFFYMKQYIESSMPLEVIEAARVDGSNEFRTFNAIAVPMLKPAFAVQLIFGFVASWNNFFTPALVIDSSDNWTLPIMMSILRSKLNSQNGDLGEVYMMILLSIIPVVIVYLFLSKFIVKGVALGAVKG